VRNTEGTVTNYVAIFSDLTNRKEIEARLDFLAYYDPLTSLPNRTQLNERLHQALARPVRKSMALLVLDVDRFKLINDTLGHESGDRILLAVAERLTAIVPDGACVCRLGGDEFAIFLDDLGKPDEAANVARNIQRALRHAITFDSQDIHLSASIGISLSPEDGETVDEITGSADTAMYAAMESGGNTYRYFRQEMNSHSAERMRIESRLHSALERRELEVYYQPLVSTKSGQIVGAEALLRWFNEDLGGFVSPATFIPLLEETGLIIPVGEWVIRTACKENSHWREATGNDFFVAVNLSAVQLADDQLINKISRILEDLAFPANCLEIELTESAMMRDAAKGVTALHQLKALGVSLSIDDFGTGYSSLSYLKQLPLDVLKIDRSFITETPYLPESVSIVKAIVALGHSLQLDIIAEGVEELEQVEFLREAAVDILQGYHFSRPVPSAEFRRLVTELGRFPMPIIEGPNLQLASVKIA
jgi:diguanylate cyclase (GGDEF)-like protein